MSQIKDEKMNDSSLNGPNAHHGGNMNHKPKDEFHGGGRGGRGNRFQPYGGLNRDRKGPRENSNNMVNILYYTVFMMCRCLPIVVTFCLLYRHFQYRYKMHLFMYIISHWAHLIVTMVKLK